MLGNGTIPYILEEGKVFIDFKALISHMNRSIDEMFRTAEEERVPMDVVHAIIGIDEVTQMLEVLHDFYVFKEEVDSL